MRVNEFYTIADAFAPKRLSDEYCARYGAYDNSGILVDTGEAVKGVLFSLDLSLAAVDKAIETGANLLITHHPAIYGKISDIRVSDFSPLGKKLVKCIKNGISVLSMHLNLDAAAGGIDESLMDGLRLCAERASKGTGTHSTPVLRDEVTGGGYGRAYDINEIPLGALVKELKKEFHTDRIAVYGEKDRILKRAASFCGGGADEAAVEFAVKNGADVIVSSDFKHHVLSLANECGLAAIVLTHYASENYGFKKYYEKIRLQTEIPCGYHTDESLL